MKLLADLWGTFWPLIVVPGIFVGYGVIRATIDELNPNSRIRRQRRQQAARRAAWAAKYPGK